MAKEIIINAQPDQTRIAIVEDGELVELYIENPDNARTLGDIHLGRVKRILPGIKAAFVDIGQKQDAFLHFSDLSDNLPEILDFVGEDVPGLPKDRSLPRHPHTRPGEHPTLETETTEEERAAKRLREVSRRRDEDEDKPEDGQAAESTDESGDQPKRRRRRRRGGRRRRKASDEQQDQQTADASADGEPDAKQQDAKPKGRRSSKQDDAAQAAGQHAGEQAQDAQDDDRAQDEKPKKRRSRSRKQDDDGQQDNDKPKRARRKKDAAAQNDGPGVLANEDLPANEDLSDEERSDFDRAARTPGAAEGATPEPAAPEAQEAQDDDRAQDEKPKKRRSRSRKKAGDGQQADDKPKRARPKKRDDEPEADTPQQPEPPDEPKQEDSTKEQPKKEQAESEKPEATKPKAAKPPSAKPAAPKKTSSRFVIDLTSKPGRLDPDDVEEEEEEEEKRSGRSRSSRRSSSGRRRSSSGRGRSRGGSGRNGSGGGSGGGSGRGKDDGNGNGGKDDEDMTEPPKVDRDRPIHAYLKQGQSILAKVIKEPISAKGSRVSTDISLAGRFLVLVPLADYVAVSKKISSPKERKRLRALARSLLPQGFGLIVRTVAEGRDAKALDADLQLLLKKWRKIENGVRSAKKPPVLVHEDVDMVSSVIRDLFSEDYDRILVDDPEVYRQIKNYVSAVAPDMAKAVQRHTSKENVFRAAGIDKQVTAAFESRVSLPGGGYLFIEHTEAMHVVDVNSGRAGRGLSQEENALRVNLEAAREITKQLRLRDLGGIICVDFIDMRSDSYRKKVHDEIKKQFRKDRAVTKVIQMSDFGVVQITRQRLRPSVTTQASAEDMEEASAEENVHGRAEPKPFPTNPAVPARRAVIPDEAPTAADVLHHLEDWLTTYRDEVSEKHRRRPVLLRVHPFLAAYLHRGLPSTFFRWRVRFRLPLKLEVDEQANPLAFSVLDEKSGKDLTRKYDPARRVSDDDSDDTA